VEEMKYINFFRDSNKFNDILTDPVIKNLVTIKSWWYGHLMIGVNESHDQAISYIMLKYGDEMRGDYLVTDRTPVPGIDYTPKR
jgi:hypothetical protein